MNEAIISHQGEVVRVEDKAVFVKILSQAACSNCHAKGACSGFESEEKVIEVNTEKSHVYKVGQSVSVAVTQRLGFIALFWGYLLPFLLMTTALITVNLLWGRQEIAGLASLAILIPYYINLYFFRTKLKKIFQFEIK